MTQEQKFLKALEDIFVGAPVEGESGFINLMQIKSRYYERSEASGGYEEFWYDHPRHILRRLSVKCR